MLYNTFSRGLAYCPLIAHFFYFCNKRRHVGKIARQSHEQEMKFLGELYTQTTHNTPLMTIVAKKYNLKITFAGEYNSRFISITVHYKLDYCMWHLYMLNNNLTKVAIK